jgi:alpha-L-rhamnosidase
MKNVKAIMLTAVCALLCASPGGAGPSVDFLSKAANGNTQNLARGKGCSTFSSLERNGFSAACLTDGQRGGTSWSSKAFSAYADHRLYPEFITVDLGKNCALERIELFPFADGKGFPEDFTIQVCREGEPWKIILEKRGYPAPENGNAQVFELPKTEGRYVKIEATRLRPVEDSKYRLQLSELEVLGREKAAVRLVAEATVPECKTMVTGLRCEHFVDPIGVDAEKPRLDWIMEASVRGERQTAYRVVVATSRQLLDADHGDLWDSGKVESDQSVAVRYGGQPLNSGQCCFWKVMVWDREGRPFPWSEPATFVTGKLKEEDWQGQWIGTNLRVPDRDGVQGFACETAKAEDVMWVQLDLGSSQKIDRIVLHPMFLDDPAAGGWTKGYAFPVRFRIDLSDDAEFKTSSTVADQTQADYPNPGYAQASFDAAGRAARYVRLTVTRLWQRGAGQYACALGEMEVFSDGKNVALHTPVTTNSSDVKCGWPNDRLCVVAGFSALHQFVCWYWSRDQLTDGKSLSPTKPEEQLRYPHGAIYLRKEITIGKPVKRATAFVCGLGFSEFHIDGAKVGDGLMTPGFTTYDKRVQYLVHDVTDRFSKPGRKALGVVLVDGWYALAKDLWVHMFNQKPYIDEPKLRLELHLEFADSTETTFVTDPSWKWSQGEITRSWLCEEDIDLRQAQPGWDQVGFDDSAWKTAGVVKGPQGRLVCQREKPTRVMDIIKPQTLASANGGKAWVYDFGREFTGALRFRTTGPTGTRVKLTVFSPVYPRVSAFTLAGKGMEEYGPRFCYGAISRVMVEGVAAAPSLEDLSAVELSGVADVSGQFRCSNDLLNWLHESARRTQKAYVTYLPNDPTREFKAWMEDPQNMFGSAVHLYDSRAMYERWQHDILDCQREDGNGPSCAPGPVFDGNSAWWGGCLVWVPWHWYLHFGDPSLLFESYEAMKRYMDFLARMGQDHIQHWGGLADWLDIDHTFVAIVDTPAYYLYARILSRTAAMLGHEDDANRYAKLSETIQSKFNAQFLDPATGNVAQAGKPCTPGGQALALALGLVPDAVRPKAEEALLKGIAARNNHVTTGFVATPYLLQVLADLAPEIGYTMTTQQDFPSWYSMTAGSDHNLMQEYWDGRPVLMPSLGGNIVGWHMQSLGGIRSDPTGPGYKKIIIKPNVVGDLHWVESWYDSVHGRIVSKWSRRGNQLIMDFTIPANTTATVFVPAKDAASATESGKPAEKAEGVKFMRMENGAAVYEVGSGCYRFCSEN